MVLFYFISLCKAALALCKITSIEFTNHTTCPSREFFYENKYASYIRIHMQIINSLKTRFKIYAYLSAIYFSYSCNNDLCIIMHKKKDSEREREITLKNCIHFLWLVHVNTIKKKRCASILLILLENYWYSFIVGFFLREDSHLSGV